MNNRAGGLIVAAIAISATSIVGISVPAQANNAQRLIVTFESNVDDRNRSAIAKAGAAPLKELKLVDSMVVTVPNSAVAQRLKNLEDVETVEVDARTHATAPPHCSPWPACRDAAATTPPPQVLPWGVDRIDAEKSWSASRGTGVKVAVLDTGIDQNHADLAGNVAGGINFVKGRGPSWKLPDPDAWKDDHGHGTHVAGTIAAADNTIGVVGVAPEADLYGVKVLDANGYGYASDVALGIEWSIEHDMQVVSMSLAENSDVTALRESVELASEAGIVVIAAAANAGDGDASTNDVLWPAKYDSVIAVAAIDSNDTVAGFSSDGAEVELAAPGVNILSTTLGGGYGTMNGTSAATPHVSGVVANILAAPVVSWADSDGDGLWSGNEIRAYLQATADDLGSAGRDVFYGYGIVDSEEAVTGVQTQ